MALLYVAVYIPDDDGEPGQPVVVPAIVKSANELPEFQDMPDLGIPENEWEEDDSEGGPTSGCPNVEWYGPWDLGIGPGVGDIHIALENKE